MTMPVPVYSRVLSNASPRRLERSETQWVKLSLHSFQTGYNSNGVARRDRYDA
jgi:hypothetical protein